LQEVARRRRNKVEFACQASRLFYEEECQEKKFSSERVRLWTARLSPNPILEVFVIDHLERVPSED
jgi:hypothetical protein